MKTRAPARAEPELQEYATRLGDELDIEFKKRTPDQNARNNLLLAAPDGSIWAVTVDIAGALSTTKVYG